MKCLVVFLIFFMIAPFGCHVLNLEIEYTDDGLLQGKFRRKPLVAVSYWFSIVLQNQCKIWPNQVPSTNGLLFTIKPFEPIDLRGLFIPNICVFLLLIYQKKNDGSELMMGTWMPSERLTFCNSLMMVSYILIMDGFSLVERL